MYYNVTFTSTPAEMQQCDLIRTFKGSLVATDQVLLNPLLSDVVKPTIVRNCKGSKTAQEILPKVRQMSIY